MTNRLVEGLDNWGVVGVALLMSLSILGCSDAPVDLTGVAPTPVPTTLTLSATELSFSSLGASEQLTATVRDQNGATMSGASVAWVSSPLSVASVSSTGLVAAVADGAATITATSGSANGTASVTVGQVAASVTLSPSSLVLAGPGATATVTASVLDAGGSAIANPDLTWSSSDESIATVSSSGLVTAVASGSATIAVTSGGPTVTQALSITVEEGVLAGSAGGGVSLADDAVNLVFPPGALSEAVFITAEPATGLPVGLVPIPGTAFAFGPDGTVFAEPVTLTIGYDPANVPQGLPEEELRLHKLVGSGYVQVDAGVVDVANHTVSGAIDGFSVFVILRRLAVTTASLPSGVTGTAYSQTLAVTGGDGTYTWALINATTLPAGLGLNMATGEISGTPTAAATTNFEVEVTSAGQTATKVLSITVNATLAVTTTTPMPTGTVSVAYSQTLTATGGDGSFTWALFNATTLPAGLVLNTATGLISGTPSAVGTTNFTVAVTSAGQTATKVLSITVNATLAVTTTSPLPNGTVSVAYSQTLAATGGDGTFTWAMFDATTLPAGLALNTATGEISGTPTAAGGTVFTVAVTSAGQTAAKALAITIGLPAPVTGINVTLSTPVPTDEFIIAVDGGGFGSVPQVTNVTGAGMTGGSVVLGVPAGGPYRVRVVAVGPGGAAPTNLAMTASGKADGVTVVSNQLAAVSVGLTEPSVAVTAPSTVTPSGAVLIKWTYTDPGAALDRPGLDGRVFYNTAPIQDLIGTQVLATALKLSDTSYEFEATFIAPPVPGTIHFHVSALTFDLNIPGTSRNGWYVDPSTGEGQSNLTIAVTPAAMGISLGISSVVATDEFIIAVDGGGFGSVPQVTNVTGAGMTGGSVVLGVPAGGPYRVRVVAVGPGGAAPTNLAMIASGKADGVTVVSGQLSAVSVGLTEPSVAVTAPSTATPGGSVLIKWTYTDPGAALDRPGLDGRVFYNTAPIQDLIGTQVLATALKLSDTSYEFEATFLAPLVPGTLHFHVSAQTFDLNIPGTSRNGWYVDPSMGEGQSNLTIAVISPPSITTSSPMPNGTVSVAYSQTLAATGGDGTFKWALINATTLPAGLVLNTATGLISDIPTAAGATNFTVEVTSAGQTATKALSITVFDPLKITTTSLPSGVTTAFYSAMLTATGGAGSYTWALASGLLPPGLFLATNGEITGVPSVVGTSNFTVEVRSVGETATKALSIVVAAPGPFTLLPVDWRMPVGEQVQFVADGSGGATLTWSVNGIPGGNAGVGVIDNNGLYTAPAAVPIANPVTVRAALVADPATFSESPVTSTPGGEQSEFLQSIWTPRAISLGLDSATFEVTFSGYPRFGLARPSGTNLTPVPLRSGVYAFRLSATEVLTGYVEGDLHNFVGFLNCDLCALSPLNIFVNVADATVPSVPVTSLGANVQEASHVVNIRSDVPFVGVPPADVFQTFYAFFPDNYDFLAVIEPVNRVINQYYRGVRNATDGLGIPRFDGSGFYGSPARLLGLIHFPNSVFFDAGHTLASHEIGHQWMARLDNAILASGQPHWPISSIASGIMGSRGSFPFEVTQVTGNIYQLVCSDPFITFNDLELYMMGLIPPDSVSTHVVFQDQNISRSCGSQGATDPISIQDIIAVNGARVPDHTSQKDFRLATMILSTGRLLSPEEMAFFNHMAERGEARTELHYTLGFGRGTTKPFFLATGGRATLTTRLR